MTPRQRAPDIELYDRGCDLVEAAAAIHWGVVDAEASPAFPAVLGCLEAALRELGEAAAALQAHDPSLTATDAKAQAVADRLERGYTNLRVAMQDAAAASRAARRLAARAAAQRQRPGVHAGTASASLSAMQASRSR